MRLTLPVLAWSQRNGLFFALVIMTVFFSLYSERFLTPQNISVILQQVAVVGIIAVPGAMLVLAGYVDLSVGSIAVFAATIFGKSMEAGWGLPVSLVLRGHSAGVDAAIAALNDPKSPDYHHFLSRGEYARRFGVDLCRSCR